MELDRAGGILLHPTSLPSRYGIGDLGPEAYNFLDFLKESRLKLWQILPLHPVGYGESPYQSYSAFAGNPLLISIDELYKEGLITGYDMKYLPVFPPDRVEYSRVMDLKNMLLRRAFERFRRKDCEEEYSFFLDQNSFWLPDFLLFMALKEHFNGLPWNRWDHDIAFRRSEAVLRWEGFLAQEMKYQCFLQYKFASQWQALKAYAKQKGITVIGDLPLFISYDSSDTWINPHLFDLDQDGYPARVAGVPPDYFSETGQLWGNPLYRWDKMEEDDYYWWRERIQKLLEQVDVVRIDHFRGFEAYWEIPGGEKTAVNGRWVKGPDQHFFTTLERHLGKLPILAEDLGFITREVHELRNHFNYPGMKVLQFLNEEPYLERPEKEKVVYYTGTHDNDTLLGWYKDVILDSLDNPPVLNEEVSWEFIELVFASNADWIIVPLQDILCLGSEGRMNTPGTIGGNWMWRCRPGSLTKDKAGRLAYLAKKYNRDIE